MKKIKFIHRLVASATSAMILLCGGGASFSAVADSEIYSFELSADGYYYYLRIDAENRSEESYPDIPSEYNGLPVDVNNQFYNCVNATSLDIPDVNATPEFLSSHNPYQVTALTQADNALKTLTVRYTGYLQLSLRNAANLEEVYLYCSELKLQKATFRNNSANAIWHVANDDVKAVLVSMGIDENNVSIDISTGKSDSTLTISASAESMTYGESDITVSVTQNTSGASVAYQFSRNENFSNVTGDITVGSDGKIVPTYPGTYYMRAVTAETDDYNSATSNVIKITVNSADKSGFTSAYNEANELWYKTSEDYTEESMAALRSVYTKYTDYTRDTLHTAAEYAAAETEIREAIDALVKIDVTAERERLNSLISQAEALVSTDYTDDTWALFETAYENAKTVYGNEDSGASAVVSAAENLEKAIDELEIAPVGMPSFDCAVQFSNTGWWPQYNITETFEGNGTFTVKIDTSSQATTEAFVFNVDLLDAAANYPDIQAVLDSIKVDGTEVAFDASKIQYGDIENNGNYRIEIYNDYGSTKNDPPMDPKAMASKQSIEITFTVSGVPENDPKGDLQKLVDETEKMLAELIEGDYTAESIEAVKNAVAETKTLLEKDVLLQSEIDGATADINTAVDSMEIADTTEARAALSEAVEAAKALNKDEYTEDSWAAVQSALDKADALTDKSTISEINAVTEELNNAVSALEKLPGEGSESEPDSTPDSESGSDLENSEQSDSDSASDKSGASSDSKSDGTASGSKDANVKTGAVTGGLSAVVIISLAAATVMKKRK
ncbi:FIVAR domain-containing protein [Ruminococcus sp. Marseille-P6503]|uniref:FIVAR domain-containing protein n=1 Tax=Ruminococcus sp. Marseille-P6503 TaxID=2364796 RepID=UPI000F545137|nr:FIVAR domain-containing protein [Ruminococcus sp. Marseille-P6503]